MGCAEILPDEPINENEELLQKLEASLGFNSHTSRHLDLYIRKYASKEEMNKNQYKLIGRKLNIHLTNNEQIRTAEIYFADLLFYKGIYERTGLLIVAILMGDGTPEEKASLLFEIFDPELTGTIQAGHAMQLINVMTKISLEEAERLVSYEALTAPQARSMRAYLEKLNSVFQDVEQSIKQILFADGRDEIKLESFLKAVDTEEGSKLFSTSGIRELAEEVYDKKQAENAAKEQERQKRKKKRG